MKKNSLHIVCFVLLCLFLVIPLVSADSQTKQNSNKIQRWTPSPDSSAQVVSLVGMKSTSMIDSRKIIVNFTEHLEYLNTEMGWDLSPEQINGYSVSMRNGSLKKYVYNQTYPLALDIPSQRQFYREISDAMGLNEGESDKILQKIQEKYRKDFVDNDRPDSASIRARDLKTMENMSFGVTMFPDDSESAPYAHGKVAYFCIFTDFQYPRDIPPGFTYAWTDDAISAVMTMVSWAADDIHGAAPAGAGISSEYGYTGPDAGIYVEGSNTGNNQDSYGQNGWMERALKSIELTGGGYITDADHDGWVSDDFVQELKDHTFTDADHVVLLFLSHDNKGGYSIDPDYNDGYTDRAEVPFWAPGPTNPNEFIISQYGVYQHEILHTVGAADEYEADPQVNSCNARSFNAVSPMFELYTNTNHQDCPTHNENTVMNNPYDYTYISQSTRNFIGWGDFDGDGELDPRDATPSTFTITPGCGSGGTISPSTVVTVPVGGSQSFTITADATHEIDTIRINSVSQTITDRRSMTAIVSNVHANTQISATFRTITPSSYTITPSSGSGGTISPSTVVTVPVGGSQPFTIAADATHEIDTILVNTVPQTITNRKSMTVTVSNVQSNSQISAAFRAAPVTLPGMTQPPTDPDHDGIYEDLNGNGRLDFADVILYFNQIEWIEANEPVAPFDLNGNGRIDFGDINALFQEV